MGNFWFWLIFWVLIAIILTGVILFIVGYAAPHKDKPDNTVNYDSFKWIGVGLLIFGGLGMLVWLYIKFRGYKSKTTESSVLQEPLIEPTIMNPSIPFPTRPDTIFNPKGFNIRERASDLDREFNNSVSQCRKVYINLSNLAKQGNSNARISLGELYEQQRNLTSMGYDDDNMSSILCQIINKNPNLRQYVY